MWKRSDESRTQRRRGETNKRKSIENVDEGNCERLNVISFEIKKPAVQTGFADLIRLLPYKISLTSAICCPLMMEPHIPIKIDCQHHVHRLSPACSCLPSQQVTVSSSRVVSAGDYPYQTSISTSRTRTGKNLSISYKKKFGSVRHRSNPFPLLPWPK
ncbi:AAEL006714-PA [Aedes aegypti]|uniref:AAEL006714-PA n=1 Tax=Aedes aegypti TaxID=7159 RepID=Q175C1_AEDAE|nr:AAEL006714-PA [Aedes aegypti]